MGKLNGNGNVSGEKKDSFEDIPHERKEPRPDFSTPPPRKRLPKELQETLDNEEKLWETLYEGKAAESTDTNLRYAAYASRIRTVLSSAHRYVAYTSDIGESFRPVAHPYLVRAAYGVSWAYLTGDVAYEGYKAYLRNERVRNPHLHEEKPVVGSDKLAEATAVVRKLGPGMTEGRGRVEEGEMGHVPGLEDWRTVMAQRAIFQGLASMGLPAFTIHSLVKYSGKAMKDVKNHRIRTYGPIGLGLAVVPFLPFIFDEPVEKATEWAFHTGFKAFGGPEAVQGRPATGNKELRYKESKEGAEKEKEL